MSKHNSKTARLKTQGVLNPHPQHVQASWFDNDTFFDPRDLVQVKYEMLRLARVEGASKADAAARFGLSRPTFYQTEAAYAEHGIAGLLPRQRGPKGAHKLDATVMAFIDAHIDQHGPVSARRLAPLIETEFGLQVHPRSIERALLRKKNGPASDVARITDYCHRTLRDAARPRPRRWWPAKCLCRVALSRHVSWPSAAGPHAWPTATTPTSTSTGTGIGTGTG